MRKNQAAEAGRAMLDARDGGTVRVTPVASEGKRDFVGSLVDGAAVSVVVRHGRQGTTDVEAGGRILHSVRGCSRWDYCEAYGFALGVIAGDGRAHGYVVGPKADAGTLAEVFSDD